MVGGNGDVLRNLYLKVSWGNINSCRYAWTRNGAGSLDRNAKGTVARLQISKEVVTTETITGIQIMTH